MNAEAQANIWFHCAHHPSPPLGSTFGRCSPALLVEVVGTFGPFVRLMMTYADIASVNMAARNGEGDTDGQTHAV